MLVAIVQDRVGAVVGNCLVLVAEQVVEAAVVVVVQEAAVEVGIALVTIILALAGLEDLQTDQEEIQVVIIEEEQAVVDGAHQAVQQPHQEDREEPQLVKMDIHLLI